MEEQGEALTNFVEDGLESMAYHARDAVNNHIDLFATLVEDPDEFVKKIEEEPWRVAELVSFVAPMQGVNVVVKSSVFTYDYTQIVDLYQESDIEFKLPKDMGKKFKDKISGLKNKKK